MAFVQANTDKPWGWKRLSANPSITFDDVLSNPDRSWNWFFLSCNPSITWEVVKANPDKPWNRIRLSRNPSITLDDVVAHPGEPWNWFHLSSNPRMLITKADEARIGKTRLIITRLQRRWRACITDPSHPVCRRRLTREWDELH